jgi:DNA-binding MarR family transcriptional regulator
VIVTELDPEDVARLRVGLARIARVLDRQTRGHALTRTQASVLGTAARLGPVRITELAEIEGVNPTMLSRIVAKLEDAGLLHRQADPDDRRAALVEPTAEGRALQHRLREERTRLLVEHLTKLPDDHAAQLLAALPAIEALADALASAELSV